MERLFGPLEDMLICLDRRRLRYILFALLAVSVNLIDSAVIRSAVDARQRLIFTAAAWVDMVVVITALYYWLLVRPGIRGKWSLAPVALAGVLHAASSKALVAGVCELALIAFVIVQVRGLKRSPDPVRALESALQKLFPPRLASVVAAEFGILYYAVFSWRAKPHVPAGTTPFTIHKKSMHRDLLYAAALLSVIEIIPAHILIHLWNPMAAWTATGLSLYAAVWLLGLARSIDLRPSLAGDGYVEIRYGLLFRLRVERDMIAQVRRATAADVSSATVVPRRSDPTVCIELAAELEAEKMFGMRSKTSRIAIAADECFDDLYPILTKPY
jgi:hypothetical protein